MHLLYETGEKTWYSASEGFVMREGNYDIVKKTDTSTEFSIQDCRVSN